MRLGLWTLLSLLCVLVALSWQRHAAPLSRAEIDDLTERFFHYATVGFVHRNYVGDARPHFGCVEAGLQLSDAQSREYREAVWHFLASQQSFFARLDAQLTLADDICLAKPNNQGGLGVVGRHDDHDTSANRNMQAIDAALSEMADANPLRRIVLAHGAYKNLMDLMVHFGPMAQSVGVRQPRSGSGWPAYDRAFSAFKTAQFSRVNSADYQSAVAQGLVAYGDLVETVQARVRLHNGPVLNAITGNFLSRRSLAPNLAAEPRRIWSEDVCFRSGPAV